MKKKDDKTQKKQNGKKSEPEQSAVSKLNKRIKEGEERKIPKGHKATISDAGAIIMISETSDISGEGKKKEKQSKKEKAVSPKAPKKAERGPALKSSASNSTVTKKPAKSTKKRTVNLLKHSDKDEMDVTSITPVIINIGNAKSKPVPKVLRRVAKTGGYTAWDDVKKNGKTFATEKEAKDYVADLYKKTGKVVLVSQTDRQVTHSFKTEEKTNKQ